MGENDKLNNLKILTNIERKRNSAYQYISKSGKIIPVKQMPEYLCQCPQKCDDRIDRKSRKELYDYFYSLPDIDKQNAFLRKYLTIRTPPLIQYNFLNNDHTSDSNNSHSLENKVTTVPPRRITCKYLLPILSEGTTLDVCQKAFVSAFVISEKRVRRVREKMFSKFNNQTQNYTINSSQATQNKTSIITTTTTSQPSSQSQNLATPDFSTVKIPLNHLPYDVGEEYQTILDQIENDFEEKKDRGDDKTGDEIDDEILSNPKYNPFIPLNITRRVTPDSDNSLLIMPIMNTQDQLRDMTTVNNFFSQQLWKFEYFY